MIFFLHRNGEASLSLPNRDKPDLRRQTNLIYHLYLKCKKNENAASSSAASFVFNMTYPVMNFLLKRVNRSK